MECADEALAAAAAAASRRRGSPRRSRGSARWARSRTAPAPRRPPPRASAASVVSLLLVSQPCRRRRPSVPAGGRRRGRAGLGVTLAVLPASAKESTRVGVCAIDATAFLSEFPALAPRACNQVKKAAAVCVGCTHADRQCVSAGLLERPVAVSCDQGTAGAARTSRFGFKRRGSASETAALCSRRYAISHGAPLAKEARAIATRLAELLRSPGRRATAVRQESQPQALQLQQAVHRALAQAGRPEIRSASAHAPRLRHRRLHTAQYSHGLLPRRPRTGRRARHHRARLGSGEEMRPGLARGVHFGIMRRRREIGGVLRARSESSFPRSRGVRLRRHVGAEQGRECGFARRG